MDNSAFDEWYNGMVGFHINSERMLDDLNSDGELEITKLEKWMRVCWNQALEAAHVCCRDDGSRYPWEHARQAISSLVAKT